MTAQIDKLTEHSCSPEKSGKVCRSRGGESCAFDGAMIVLQPIADTAHIVHGPIACCGNSWEGRGSLSSRGNLDRMGFTTAMSELDIIYGSGEKLLSAIRETFSAVRPKAIFVHATCVSGLIGEDIEAVCRKACSEIGIPVIPVNAPGFVGPKNLGNRIAGEVLLEHVIGTGEPACTTDHDINLIGEYNIAGDLWLVARVLEKAGLRVLSRISGDATIEEITWAHKAKLNVVVCSRALINVAKEMEKRYGIPYVEVSFFGKTEMTKALRAISRRLTAVSPQLRALAEEVIAEEEKRLTERLITYEHLRGKKAVLYTGGVKSWSFISALQDLGIEIVGVGTKKSTVEDEEKMKQIMGEGAPLLEDVTPQNLLKTLKEKKADMLIAGGRNLYLAVKEGYPFVDVNQERHIAYAGYDGLVNLAEQISNGMRFYERTSGIGDLGLGISKRTKPLNTGPILIDPLRHSAAIGAAMALQGIDRALPVIHGAQGCTFLGKVLLTKHFREPIALAGTKLFAEDVIMGSDDKLADCIKGFIGKNSPDLIGVLTSGLSEIKGDDIAALVRELDRESPTTRLLHVPTPDFQGGLESGYKKAVEVMLTLALNSEGKKRTAGQVTVLAGPHLSPADCNEIKEIMESFGLKPLLLPDLSSLDGSREGVSPLAVGGTTVEMLKGIGSSDFTIALGGSMDDAAGFLFEKFGTDYRVFYGPSDLAETDEFFELLTVLSGRPVPQKYMRQRRICRDGLRDAHFFTAGKRVCIALDTDAAVHFARLLRAAGCNVTLAVIPEDSERNCAIMADRVVAGDLFSIDGDFDLMVSSSHAEGTAKRLGVPLFEAGFPVYKYFGNTARVGIGYKGTLGIINEVANIFVKEVHS